MSGLSPSIWISAAYCENELGQQESLWLHALLGCLDVGIVIEDERRKIQLCNHRFCDLFGWSEPTNTFVGMSAVELTRRVSEQCFIPEAFIEEIEMLVTERRLKGHERLFLADMRVFERDYAPLLQGTEFRGHLWVYRDVTAREQANDLLQRQADELRALSLIDELTGLYNRRGFLTLATQQIKLCDKTLRPALIAFIDLDGMKRINDALGHEYGDTALVETANVLRLCFRYSDVIARLGGDEFVVLALDADTSSQARIMRRIHETLREHNSMAERKFQLSFSVGIVPYDPEQPEMIEAVLARADALMYEEKRRHKALARVRTCM